MTKGRPRLQLEGRTFGRLTVVSFSHIDDWCHSVFNCKCECGTERRVSGHSLTAANGTRSCGCLIVAGLVERSTTHGHATGGTTPEYKAWHSMHQRCRNPNVEHYHRYGGRGITVCRRWAKFDNFFRDMGKRPIGRTLDRKNNDGNYTPSNCRWATPRQQSRNSSLTTLSVGKVRKIKSLLREGRTHLSIATDFGVGREAIGKISRGERWGDIA